MSHHQLAMPANAPGVPANPSAMPARVPGVPTPQQPTNGQPYAGNMDQVGSGPAGLLYTLANELMAIYNEIEALYNEMTVSQVNAQAETIKAGADAQRAAATQQAWSIGCQAIGSAASGVASGVTMFAEGLQNNANIKQLEKTEQPALATLNKLNDATKTVDDNVILADDQLPNAQTRAQRLLQGNHEPSNANAPQAEQDAENALAYKAMRPEQRIQFKNALQEKITAAEKRVNTTQSRINYTQTSINTVSQFATGCANTAAQAGQAVATAKSERSRAAQQVANSVNQMENSTAETTRSNISMYYGQIAALIQAARSGAQAYAQT